jgi:hypothetical protein
MAPQITRQSRTDTLGANPSARAKQPIAGLVGMLLIGAIAAVIDWPWWLGYAFMAPFAVLCIARGRLVVYRQLSQSSDSTDRRVPVILAVPVLLAAAIVPTRISSLVVGAAFVVLFSFGRQRMDRPTTIKTP